MTSLHCLDAFNIETNILQTWKLIINLFVIGFNPFLQGFSGSVVELLLNYCLVFVWREGYHGLTKRVQSVWAYSYRCTGLTISPSVPTRR